MIKSILLTTALLLSTGTVAHAFGISDYLILEDIGPYRQTPEVEFMGKLVARKPACLQGGDDISGIYNSCRISYAGGAGNLSITVEARVYKSGQWILHDLEDAFRDHEKFHALLDPNVRVRTINGKNLFVASVGGGKTYTWGSGKNVRIEIRYSTYSKNKPEPMDVVKAYLAKYPSTMTLKESEFRSKAHSEQWLREEMNRHLWLAEQQFTLASAGISDINEVLKDIVDNLEMFLSYREHFYAVKASSNQEFLVERLDAEDAPAIKNLLNEYKTWWSENKTREFLLETPDSSADLPTPEPDPCPSSLTAPNS